MLAVALACVSVGCTSFNELAAEADAATRDADSRRDAGGDANNTGDAHHDGAVAAKDATATDAQPADVGAPPAGDFECKKPWNRPTASADPACAGVRTVTVIEPVAVTTGGISIARTSAGNLGIAYDYAEDADTIGMHVAVFPAPKTAESVYTPTITVIGLGPESNLGIPSAIAAGGADDTLHLVYVDHDQEEMLYQPMTGSTAVLGSTELVASGIGAGSYTSLAVSSGGLVRTTYYVPSTGAVRSAARDKGGGFAAPSELVTGLLANAQGTGQSSLVFDDQDTPNAIYQQCEVDSFSTPEYTTFDGSSWSVQKTIDNNMLNGSAGYSVSLAVSGSEKYAAYYYLAATQSTSPTAELHLAQWQLSTDTPQITILDTVIPANDPNGSDELLRFQVAMAVDKFGLLHIVAVRPFASNQSASVQYIRQAVVDGTVKWLTDVVDDDVFAPSIDDLSPNAFVAITVDDDARPHIAYRSGKDSSVRYATRFDR